MQIGLIGKANVGKSTFFSAATRTDVASANFPFTTIDPNIGVAFVRTRCACGHFGIGHRDASCSSGTRLIPVKLVDVAGLVPGAHEGKGLGNRFLDDARQSEVLIHVVDAAGATDIQGQPVSPNSHNPFKDITFVQDEFDQWFADILRRDLDRIAREVDQKRSNVAEGVAKRFTGLGIDEAQVQASMQKTGITAKNPRDWGKNDIMSFVRDLREATKPMVMVANKADLAEKDDPLGGESIPCSAETELLLRKAAEAGLVKYTPGDGDFAEGAGISAPQQRALNMARKVLSRLSSTGVQRALDEAVFGKLKMIVVYPVEDETHLTNKDGKVLPDAKLVRPGTTARDLAGMIHKDIADGFLHAIDCKTKQRIGAEHILHDGDVVKVVSTLSRG